LPYWNKFRTGVRSQNESQDWDRKKQVNRQLNPWRLRVFAGDGEEIERRLVLSADHTNEQCPEYHVKLQPIQ